MENREENSPMVVAKNLTKTFGKDTSKQVVAVSDATFAVKDGEIFGLLGPNGAGKTTTLRMLATILRPTSGTAIINGYSVTEEPRKVRMSIGFLTGETRLYERLTVRETLQYFGRLYSMEEKELERRIEELIRSLGLVNVADRWVGSLSDGTRQRVALARTIIHCPSTLILDEPLTGLDILARRAVIDFIKEWRKSGCSVIFSTHVTAEAEELCDRIGIICNGKIVDVGEKEVLKSKYGKATIEEILVNVIGGYGEESNSDP